MPVDKISLKYGRWGTYNNPEVNERKAELPLGFWFAGSFPEKLIEIGEVTPFYRPPGHLVCDMLPEKTGTMRVDAATMDLRESNVLSISTVEHVGTADYGLAPEPGKAFALVRKITQEAVNWLVTFAVGYNRELEREIVQAGLHYIVLVRKPDNTWFQSATNSDLGLFQYNSPLPHGNAVIVVTNLPLEVSFDGYVD